MCHRKRLVLATIIGAAVAGCASPGDRLHALLDEAWDAQMKWSPVWATSLGDHRYNNRLSTLSHYAQTQRAMQLEWFARRLKVIPQPWLTPEDRQTADLFEHHLRTRLCDLRPERYLAPLNQLAGPHLALPLILVSQPFNDYRDYVNYVSRLRAFPEQVDQAIECMRIGIEKGLVPPQVVIEPVPGQIDSQIVDDPMVSVLYTPTRTLPGSLTDEECVEIATHVWLAIDEAVVPAYRILRDFMENEYLPACRETVGIWDLPGGDSTYDELAHRYTTTHMSAEEIHQVGLDELTRIHDEMDDIRRALGFEGTLAEFMGHMRDDPAYRAPSGQWLLDRYAAILDRSVAELPKLFGRLPEAKCVVKEIESFRAPSAPVAYYNGAAPDGSRPGYFYVNTHQPEERLTYTTEALTYHEAVPGHHLQFSLHAEDESMPMFRRYEYITAYSEGWALYAEGLGDELGGYTDPLQRFGRLTFDAWRAARLVVDTGIHRFRWTRQQAIEFMEANTALARFNIEREVDRYIAWPGQALAYKIGEIVIRDLRAEAERRLGKAFDLRAFHDRILAEGCLPLDTLAAEVRDWIRDQAKAPKNP